MKRSQPFWMSGMARCCRAANSTVCPHPLRFQGQVRSSCSYCLSLLKALKCAEGRRGQVLPSQQCYWLLLTLNFRKFQGEEKVPIQTCSPSSFLPRSWFPSKFHYLSSTQEKQLNPQREIKGFKNANDWES